MLTEAIIAEVTDGIETRPPLPQRDRSCPVSHAPGRTGIHRRGTDLSPAKGPRPRSR